MRVAAISITAVLATTACARQHHIGSLKTGQSVTVETIDGAEIDATVLAHPSEVVLADGKGRIIPTKDIVRAVEVKRARGALQGAIIVGFSGLAVGAAIGFSQGDDECGDALICLLPLSATDKAGLIGSGMMMVGAGVGAIAGLIIGSRDVYTFGSSLEARIKPSGPAGSVAGMTIEF